VDVPVISNAMQPGGQTATPETSETRITFDVNELTLSSLSQSLYGLQQLYMLAAVTEVELHYVSPTMTSPQQLTKLFYEARRRLDVPEDARIVYLSLNSPLTIGLMAAPTLLGLIKLIRDWPSTLERQRLRNDQLRAETEAFRREHGLPLDGTDAVAGVLETVAEMLPPVLEVVQVDGEPA
jgi:hypothetical protein